MTIYETAKQNFRPLARTTQPVGLLPIKTDGKTIIFGPAAQGMAMVFYNMLPQVMKKEHGDWKSVDVQKGGRAYSLAFLKSAFTSDATALAYALENEDEMQNLEYTAIELS
jgi:hypothetical protein